QTARKSTGG
nr:Chain C, 9-mer peptide QTARKSTGG [Homo sapiens]7CL0_D Chain D, THR-ALA-ARG-LYS-SER-THR-GLY [Homo sapiens]7CL1_C Chain C, THR-ALA-ARG-LYS-SER-THR-GLY-GLY [Homo sapiens]